jgi:2-methylaconitate cis-trans-isomerase PrpF
MRSGAFIEGLLVRGGTSKGVFFKKDSFPVPNGGTERDAVIRRIFGVPDVTGMQIDGLGGGISSTSKVVFLSRANDNLNCDVVYDFGTFNVVT